MMAWLFGLFLLLPLVFSFKYDPLTILVMHPTRMPPLSKKIQTGLFAAIQDLSQKISVAKESITFLDSETLGKCVQNKETVLTVRDTLTNLSDIVNVSKGVPLYGYNFALVIELNSKICQEGKVLATARPCEPIPNHRPLIGLLNICDGSRWNEFVAAKDLFRHEILHSLGFGTIEPENGISQVSPPLEIFEWFDGYRRQKVRRHFLDFSSEAIKTVRSHFGCPHIQGVEAENADKIHLNEYIYGNELMTPRLTNGLNPFSFISAEILEQTYTGSIQWYKINRTALVEEDAMYWYGRGWGCKFARGSCHEINQWPFCSKQNLHQGFLSYCVKDRLGKVRRHDSKCMTFSFSSRVAEDTGIKATQLLTSPKKGIMGEPSLFRFCSIARVATHLRQKVIIQDVFEDRIEVSPGSSVFPC